MNLVNSLNSPDAVVKPMKPPFCLTPSGNIDSEMGETGEIGEMGGTGKMGEMGEMGER